MRRQKGEVLDDFHAAYRYDPEERPGSKEWGETEIILNTGGASGLSDYFVKPTFN